MLALCRWRNGRGNIDKNWWFRQQNKHLVGGIPTPLQTYESQLGFLFPIQYIDITHSTHHWLVVKKPSCLKNDGVRQWEG